MGFLAFLGRGQGFAEVAGVFLELGRAGEEMFGVGQEVGDLVAVGGDDLGQLVDPADDERPAQRTGAIRRPRRFP